jgi:cytochrome c peroxidase
MSMRKYMIRLLILAVSCVLTQSSHAADELTWAAAKQDKKLWAFVPPVEASGADAKKVALGRKLYFDPVLSADKSISCASCHKPENGFADPSQFSSGVGGKLGGRHAPSILNRAVGKLYFWDGRAKSLEEQALGPIANPVEMNLPIEEAVKRLNDSADYATAFKDVFAAAPSAAGIADAIAAYERQVYSADSPFDKWVAGDESAMSADAKKGFNLFIGKANCAKCHLGPNFSDDKFHNLGVGMATEKPDLGRFVVTKVQTDKGAFKTPGLRDLTVRAPFLHDGSAKTLEEVIELYDKGGAQNPWLSPLMKELKLAPDEKKQLLEFMKALTGTVHAPK